MIETRNRPHVAIASEFGEAASTEMSWLTGALRAAGVMVSTHVCASGQRQMLTLRGRLLRERPHMILCTGARSMHAARAAAIFLGSPLVLYRWPAGALAEAFSAYQARDFRIPMHVVVASHSQRRRMLGILGDEGRLLEPRIHILPPCVDTDVFCPGESSLKRERRGPLVGVLGRGAASPLHELPALTDGSYVLLDEEAEKGEPTHEYIDRLRGVDLVLLLDRDNEHAPRLCAEALACGRPVLCENEAPLLLTWPPSLPGSHRQAFEVVPTDALAHRIRLYLGQASGPPLRQRLGEAARNFAVNALSRDVVIEEHVDLLFEIFEERSSRSLGKRVVHHAAAKVSTTLSRVVPRLVFRNGNLQGATLPPAIGPPGTAVHEVPAIFLPRVHKGRHAHIHSITLAYHQVCAELRGWNPHMLISQRTLQRQILSLKRRGYLGVTMTQQVAQRLGVSAIPQDTPTFAVTFDDGYADTKELAAPVLLSLGVPFTVFVITDVVAGRAAAPWYDVIAHAVISRAVQPRTLPILRDEPSLRPIMESLPPSPALARKLLGAVKAWPAEHRQKLVERLGAAAGDEIYSSTPRYLSSQAVRKLHEAGVEIASHTESHPILTHLSDEDLSRELSQSRAYLVGLLGRCDGLAYPNGDQDHRVQAAARIAGYEYAAAITPLPDKHPNRYNIGRRMISELTSIGLSQAFDEDVFFMRASGFLR